MQSALTRFKKAPLSVQSLLPLFAGFAASLVLFTVTQSNTLVIDTQHLTELHPHEHTDGDSADDPGHHVEADSAIVTTERDMWVTGYELSVVNAPAVVLHHAGLFIANVPRDLCPNYKGRELLMASQDQVVGSSVVGNLPDGYGVFIPKGTPLVVSAMLHNAEPPVGPGGEYKDVYIHVVMHVASVWRPTPLHPIAFKLLHIDDVPCTTNLDDSYTFSVPKNTLNYHFSGGKTTGVDPSKFTVTATSTIVYVGAHLHGWQGGKAELLKKNGVVIQTFDTTKSPDVPYLYTTPHFPTHVELKPGDVISTEAIYDNPNDVPVRGVMGMVGMWITQ